MDQSDQQVNRGARSVLARHWIDLTKTAFASRRGILRLAGEMRRMGPEAHKGFDPANLEKIDSELRRVDGVTRVHYDLTNWRRNDDGEWELLRGDRLPRMGSSGEGDGSGRTDVAGNMNRE